MEGGRPIGSRGLAVYECLPPRCSMLRLYVNTTGGHLKGPDVGFSPDMDALFLRLAFCTSPAPTQLVLPDSLNPTLLGQA